jgi:hypothetical protein
VADGEDDAHGTQAGQGEEGDRLGVGGHVPECAERGRPGQPPGQVEVQVPNVATPTSRPSWFTVRTTPVASAASSTGTRSSTRVISGLNAAAIPAPLRPPIR